MASTGGPSAPSVASSTVVSFLRVVDEPAAALVVSGSTGMTDIAFSAIAVTPEVEKVAGSPTVVAVAPSPTDGVTAAATATDVGLTMISRDSKLWPVHVMHVRCLPLFEWGAVRFVGTVAWPWTLWVLLIGLSVGIAIESEAVFDVFTIASFAWTLTSACILDLRAWRLLLTASNALMLINVIINTACIVHLANANALNASLASICFIVFCAYPLAAMIVPLMDHDLYGLLACMPAALSPLATILVKFYATGAFIGPFVGRDTPISIWGHRFSPFVIMVNSGTQLIALVIRLLYFARESRTGIPQRVWGQSSFVTVRYRHFATDDLLLRRRHTLVMWAAHLASAALLLSLIAWKGTEPRLGSS